MPERDAERSRREILLAAEAEFAEKGFYGARVDAIAARSGRNKRMIYAYYGDKEGLWRQVLAEVYGRMEAVEQKLIDRRPEGRELVRQMVEVYFDFLQDNPTFVSLLMWENLDGGRHMEARPEGNIGRRSLRLFVEALEDGRRSGVFRSDIDPWHAALSMITACFANFSNRYTLSRLFGTDLGDEALVKARKTHTAEMILAYICTETGKVENVRKSME